MRVSGYRLKESQLLFMDLSIIIVNWNSVRYLRDCTDSIREYTRGISYEILVVDNASPAGDANVLEQQFTDIALIKSAENLGFAGANNLGFRDSSGDYVLFLNPDTKLNSPAINTMLQRLRSLPDAGIVGCKLLNTDLSIQTSCIQKFPTILNQVLDIDYLRNCWPNSRLWGVGPLFSNKSEPVTVEVVSGACLMIKRNVFEKVNHFSEDYFMYAEDLDLCYKVGRAGYANYYIGDATVLHYGGKSSSPKSATVMKWKSILRFCKKSRGSFYGLIFRLAMILAALVRLFIIAGMSLFGNALASKETRHSVFAKWGAILRTLLRPSSANG
jgi:N-acetylglucosaminyl-diphospho-decaprenol L-rhamnosyltransferase